MAAAPSCFLLLVLLLLGQVHTVRPVLRLQLWTTTPACVGRGFAREPSCLRPSCRPARQEAMYCRAVWKSTSREELPGLMFTETPEMLALDWRQLVNPVYELHLLIYYW